MMMMNDDDDSLLDRNVNLSTSKISSFYVFIQNPSSHTEEVSGIMNRMWVELLTLYRKLTIEVL